VKRLLTIINPLRRGISPLRRAVTLGCGVALLPVLALVGYVVYISAMFWGAPLFWDADAEPWQTVTFSVPPADGDVVLEARRTHPVFNFYRVRVARGNAEPEALRRYPVGDWPDLYVYVIDARTDSGDRVPILRLASSLNDHWYDLDCGCLVEETAFVPLTAERLLGVVVSEGDTTLKFEGVRATANE
jgi:hypothetical protein